MKYFYLIILSLFITKNTYSQIIEPVKISFNTEKIDNSLYWVHWEINIDSSWMIFSPYNMDQGGISLNFGFDNLTCYSITEYLIDSEVVYNDVLSDLFGISKLPLLDKKVFLRHKIRIKNKCIRRPLTGYVEYQACTEKVCLPPTYFDFEISFN